MKTTDLITFLIACLGAILGIANTLYMFRRDKVKLEVTPIHTIFGSPTNGTMKLGLKVTNLSFFPITVSDVGFQYKIKGLNMMQVSDYKGSLLPLRLSSRSAHTFYIDSPKDLWNENYDKYSYAYAITACGRSFRSRNGKILSIKNYIKDDFDSVIEKQSV